MIEQSINDVVRSLESRIETLEAEADIRRLQARYMFLCDTPCPEFGIENVTQRIDAILGLYADDAVWEGVGEYYDDQFGRAEGRDAIRAHFQRFWAEGEAPTLLLNAHYLTSEHISVDRDTANGLWIHMQPWLFSNGKSILRSSRLNNSFRRVDGVWKITRTRTENVFVAQLPDRFAESYATASVLTQSSPLTRQGTNQHQLPSSPCRPR